MDAGGGVLTDQRGGEGPNLGPSTECHWPGLVGDRLLSHVVSTLSGPATSANCHFAPLWGKIGLGASCLPPTTCVWAPRAVGPSVWTG